MGVVYMHGIPYSQGNNGDGGTDDYTQLKNLPSINGITLIGDQSTSDLNLTDNSTVFVNDKGELYIKIIPRQDILSLFN